MSSPPRLTALLPPGPRLTPAEAMAGLDLKREAPPGRPWVVLNMVATADGRAAIDGSTVGMGGAADRELFHELRTQVDAVMVGARTAAVERYGALVRGEADRAKRRSEGLEAEPLACLVSARLRIPADLPLLGRAGSRVVVATAAPEAELAPGAAAVSYVRAPVPGGRGVDLGALLESLRGEHGVRSVLCEGGPELNHALLEAALVDELFLSVVPAMTADDDAPPIVTGPRLSAPTEMHLNRVLEHEGHLFLRYRLRRLRARLP